MDKWLREASYFEDDSGEAGSASSSFTSGDSPSKRDHMARGRRVAVTEGKRMDDVSEGDAVGLSTGASEAWTKCCAKATLSGDIPGELYARLGADLTAMPLFQGLADESVKVAISLMERFSFPKDAELCVQGEVGDTFFVLESGKVEMSVDGDVVKTLEGSGAFGELALISSGMRSASVCTTADTVLWTLQRMQFRELLREAAQAKVAKYGAFLASVPLLERLTKTERSKIAKTMKEESFEAGAVIFEQGSKGDLFYVVLEGSVDIEVDGKKVATLGPAKFFGEKAILSSDTRAATVRACKGGGSPAKCLSLHRRDFDALLGPLSAFQEDDTLGLVYRMLKETPVFSPESTDDLMKLAAVMTVEKFESGQVLMTEGVVAGSMMIVVNGAVQCTHAGGSGRHARKNSIGSWAQILSGGGAAGGLMELLAGPAAILAAARSRLWSAAGLGDAKDAAARRRRSRVERRASVASGTYMPSAEKSVSFQKTKRSLSKVSAIIDRDAELSRDRASRQSISFEARRSNMVLTSGATVGMREMVSDEAMSFNVVAKDGPVTALFLTKANFNDVFSFLGPLLMPLTSGDRRMLRSALEGVKELSCLTNMERVRLAKCFDMAFVPPGKLIVRAGSAKNRVMYFVRTGQVEVTTTAEGGEKVTSTLSAGDHFNASGMLAGMTTHSVRAQGYVSLVKLPLSALENAIGPLEDVLSTDETTLRFRMLHNCPLLSVLSLTDLKKLAGHMTVKSFAQGDAVIKQGEKGEELFIVKSGSVLVQLAMQSKNDTSRLSKLNVTRLKSGDFFGESALLSGDAAIRTADVIAAEKLELYRLARADLEGAIGELEAKIDSIQEMRSTQLQTSLKGYYGSEHELQISFDDLEIGQPLGAGGYGLVRLATHSGTKRKFAVKFLLKEKVMQAGQEINVQNEVRLLRTVQSPWVCNMVATAKDDYYVMLVLEFLQGGELMDLLLPLRYMRESVVRFYIANTLLGLEALHRRKVAYRDLKPENLMVCRDGYLKLIDLGFAKIVTDNTYTMCGTPDYVAPEVLSSEGHNHAVDYWSLGILMYELIVGYSPFGARTDIERYAKISSGVYTTPSRVSEGASDLIARLLEVNPSRRLGNLRGGVDDIKNHAFFDGFDWKACEERRLKAPYRPRLAKNGDTSCFKLTEADIAHLKPPADSKPPNSASWDVEF